MTWSALVGQSATSVLSWVLVVVVVAMAVMLVLRAARTRPEDREVDAADDRAPLTQPADRAREVPAQDPAERPAGADRPGPPAPPR